MIKKNNGVRVILCLLCILSCVIVTSTSAGAACKASCAVNTNIMLLSDGSYIVDELLLTDSENPELRLASSTHEKKAKRVYTCYDSLNRKCWTFTLTATFRYDGSSAKTTAASTSYTTDVAGWKCSSRSATYSGNTAKGTASFKYLNNTVNVAIGLKCSSTGVVSNVNY